MDQNVTMKDTDPGITIGRKAQGGLGIRGAILLLGDDILDGIPPITVLIPIVRIQPIDDTNTAINIGELEGYHMMMIRMCAHRRILDLIDRPHRKRRTLAIHVPGLCIDTQGPIRATSTGIPFRNHLRFCTPKGQFVRFRTQCRSRTGIRNITRPRQTRTEWFQIGFLVVAASINHMEDRQTRLRITLIGGLQESILDPVLVFTIILAGLGVVGSKHSGGHNIDAIGSFL
mmetsp:Transcript_8658/g.8491  ORF Transcript_8658/g.8491 Transcript_8658/m.8491 type:complete len:230 (-) Transcript_8658:968-1657(-)